MTPLQHAKITAKQQGVELTENKWILEIHEWFDKTKAHVPDMRHRAMRHNSEGIFLCEEFFAMKYGATYITNSVGRDITIRSIGEQHVLEDLGFIPTLERCLRSLSLDGNDKWLGGPAKNRRVKIISLNDNDSMVEAKEPGQIRHLRD